MTERRQSVRYLHCQRTGGQLGCREGRLGAAAQAAAAPTMPMLRNAFHISTSRKVLCTYTVRMSREYCRRVSLKPVKSQMRKQRKRNMTMYVAVQRTTMREYTHDAAYRRRNVGKRLLFDLRLRRHRSTRRCACWCGTARRTGSHTRSPSRSDARSSTRGDARLRRRHVWLRGRDPMAMAHA